MPRRDDDDDYDDRYDDRPRRKHKKSGGNSTWIILGIVGGVLLLAVAGCAGGIFWMVKKVEKGMDEITMTFAGEMAAESWLEDIKQGKTKLAYDATSQGFKSAQSQAQFDQLVSRNLTLTKHTFRTTTSNNTTGTKPNQKIVLKIRLHTSDPDDVMDEDDEDMPVQPKKKPKLPKGIKPAVPEIDVTVTLIEEGGVWKVDAFTIP